MQKAFELPDDAMQYIAERIEKLGKYWAKHPKRPRPRRDVRRHWKKLIELWAENRELPLYVRKYKDNRGSIIPHKSGRKLVPTDNSPAIWAFLLACKGDKPSLKEIRNMIRRDSIPIAFSLSKEEKGQAHYECYLGKLKKGYPSSDKWELAHIDDVGLGTKKRLEEFDIDNLKKHFVKLMTLSNMFFLPEEYAGLADIRKFCEQIRAADGSA
jgi:hypothetical protein